MATKNADSTPAAAPAAPAAPDVLGAIANALKGVGIDAQVTYSTGVHDDVYLVVIPRAMS